MSIGGWAKDPSGRHEHRYYVAGAWTDDVSDAGVVSKDPVAGAEAPDLSTAAQPTPGLASGTPAPAQPGEAAAAAGRRRSRWLIGGLLGGLALLLVVVGGFLVFGLGTAVDTVQTYEADLTVGSGDFPASADPEQVREYTPDGYRMAALVPEQVIYTGVRAATTHSALEVEAQITAVTVVPTSSIGPACFGGPASANSPAVLSGFHLALGSDGQVWLVAVNQGTFTPLDTAATAPFTAGSSTTVRLVCSSAGGKSTVSGYVDGKRLVSAQVSTPYEKYWYTGIVATAHAPSQWLVTSFARRGPSAFPHDWNAST